jgi:hypothetical protein
MSPLVTPGALHVSNDLWFRSEVALDTKREILARYRLHAVKILSHLAKRLMC